MLLSSAPSIRMFRYLLDSFTSISHFIIVCLILLLSFVMLTIGRHRRVELGPRNLLMLQGKPQMRWVRQAGGG